MKKVAENAGITIAILVGAFVAIYLLLWIMVGAVSFFQFGNGTGNTRCKSHGYAYADVVVHYPDFWDVTTTCFGGSNTKGVEL